MAQLVAKDGDLSLGATDASVIALAERLVAEEVATLDQRQYRAAWPSHVNALVLLPETP